MKIDKLLEYHELDIRLSKEEIELRNSDECKNYFKTKKTYNDTMESIKQLDIEAEKLKGSFTNDSKEFEKLMNEATDISVMIDKIGQAQEMDYHLKRLNLLYADINKLEGQLKKLLDIISEITKRTKNLIFDGKKQREIYKEATDKFSVLKTKFDDAQATEKETLAKMQKDIDESLFDIYKRLKDNPSKKPPYVVQFSDPCCSGCGMDIDINQINKLKNNEIIECPNCGRIIYFQK